MSGTTRRSVDRRAGELLDRIAAERLAAGVCRHCGGPVPCWSPFGDRAVGVRADAPADERGK